MGHYHSEMFNTQADWEKAEEMPDVGTTYYKTDSQEKEFCAYLRERIRKNGYAQTAELIRREMGVDATKKLFIALNIEINDWWEKTEGKKDPLQQRIAKKLKDKYQ